MTQPELLVGKWLSSLMDNENQDATDKGQLFAELYGGSQHRVFGYILTIVRDSNDAQDILQQAAVVMWQKFDEFEVGSDFVRWALKVARYEALSYLRYRRRSRAIFRQEIVELLMEEFVRPEEKPIDSRRDALRSCLFKLKPKDRRLVESRYSLGLNARQIAEIQDRSVASVCNSLRRIRGLLSSCIQKAISLEGHP